MKDFEIPDFPDRVRAVLNADSAFLSNETINSYEFRGFAELSVKAAVPTWKDILAEDSKRLDLLKSCVVIKTAVTALPSLRRGDRKVEQTTNSKVEYFDNSAIDALSEQLEQRLELLYGQLNGGSVSSFSAVEMSNPHKKYCGGGFV